MSCDFNNSRYFKHSCVNAAKKCFLLALIFNLQNKKSKYDDNDPDNNILMSYGNKSEILFFFCGEVFDKTYLQELRIKGVVYDADSIFQ